MRKLFVCSSLSCALLACGSNAPRPAEPVETVEVAPRPSEPVSARGDEEAHATVGEAGGTLALANGARLEIPARALSGDTEVRFQVGASGRAFGDAERQRPLGPMLAIEPSIMSAGEAFELSIPQQPLPGGYSEDDLAFAVEEVHENARAIDTLGTETRWHFLPVEVRNGRFVARTDGLPGHRVQFGVAR
jgi:hypothetical protein